MFCLIVNNVITLKDYKDIKNNNTKNLKNVKNKKAHKLMQASCLDKI